MLLDDPAPCTLLTPRSVRRLLPPSCTLELWLVLPTPPRARQIVTTYPGQFISVPSAVTVTEMEVQLKKLIRGEDIPQVHPANQNRSNDASYDGLSGVYQFLL